MKQILVVDDEPARAEFVRNLFQKRNLPEALPLQLNEIHGEVKGVALVHWSMIDRAYGLLAKLRSYAGVSLLFYCLCAEMRNREKILLLPEEIDALISQIVELQVI